MKRKILMGSIALCGALAVVGSGFASWYFDKTIDDVSKNVSTHVTDLADGIGSLTDNNASDTLYIVLDQGTYANKTDATKGISLVSSSTSLSDTNAGTAVNSLGVTYSIEKAQYQKLADAGIYGGKITATISISDTSDDYIKFVNSPSAKVGETKVAATSATATQVVFEYTVNWSSATEDTFSQVLSIDTTSSDYANALLQYVSKPADKNAYDTMKAAVASDTKALSVVYTFAIDTTVEKSNN